MTMAKRLGRLCAAVVLAGMGAAASAAGADEAAAPELRAVRVTGGLDLADPEAAFWAEARPVEVGMLPQTMTTPMNPAPSVKRLTARAVHDGATLAIRLEWRDATRDDRIVVDDFGDQVAVQFPRQFIKDALPAPMMGNPGSRVEIWQWRAAFQADLERGRALETKDLYPNANIDVYPDHVLLAADARPYQGAIGLNNLITQAKGSPVLEQTAAGWGTLTLDPDDQQAGGRGVWRDGAWRVALTHPLDGGPNDILFTAGGETAIAFAVWDGDKGEVGPRKGWAPWVPLRLAP